jgi:transposase-like protein
MQQTQIDHPTCPICRVPMWLVKIDLGDIAEQQHFECKVCDKTMMHTVAANAYQPGK